MRIAPFDRIYLVINFEESGLYYIIKSYRFDTSGRSKNKEAAVIAPIVRKICDVCSADCEPYPRLQLDSVTVGRGGRGWLWQDIHLPCNTTCNIHATRYATRRKS